MQKWEYKVVHYGKTEAELNKLGDEGWELVQFDYESTTYYFKRPKK